MKFSVLICTVALFLCSAARLDAQWNWQSPLPQGNDLFRVQFIDTTFGWAVGEYGTILHTTTGGASWYEQEFARTDNVVDVHMVSPLEGWSVGDNGIILHTTDEGDDWNEQQSNVNVGLNGVYFADSLNGLAVGDNEAIVRTSDGGVTWTIQHQSAIHNSINAVTMVSDTEGWAAGANRTIYHTTDAGLTWLDRPIGVTPSNYSSIYFTDPSTGFIVGTGGIIVQTVDGGTTWNEISSGVADGLEQIVMQNAFVGWIVTDAGQVLKTVNGGASWSPTQLTPNGENLNGIVRVSGKIWVVGELGKMSKSENNGFTWFPLDTGSRLSVNWMDALWPSTAVAVGQTGFIARTTDGGATWNEQTSPVPGASFYGVKFIDPNHGWAIGDNGTILYTANGGTWNQQTSPVTHTLFGIGFSTPSNGWIVGGEFTGYTGAILHSTDGGNTWQTKQTGISNILYGVGFGSSLNGWAVGENGLILHTSDGGGTWNPQSSGTSTALFWCSFRDANNGWVVGDLGTILHTTNGGTNWTPQTSGTNVLLYSVATPGTAHVMATGDQGVVLETFDGGTTWKPRYSRTPHSLFGISAANDTTVFACGDYGTLLRYTVPDADLGTVSGYVYDDANNNGARDPGELELTGWKIVLNGPRPDSVFSGPDGSFLFTRLPFGSYTLAEVSQGSWAQTQPVTPTYSFGLIDTASNFTGDFGNYSASTWGYMMKGQWNLVSLPLTVADARKSTLYPTSASPAYAYSDHYYVMDTIRNGTGYWLKYPSSQITWIDGTGITSDTIPLVSGWNLIGSVIDSVMVASLQTDPPGILTPSIFTYNGSYVDATSISPGAGYWLKTTSAGTLYLHQGAFASSFPRSADAHAALKDLNLLTIKDAAGSSHTLYFGSQTSGSQSPGNIQPGDFALPPLPPEQCFDARFSSGSEVALFASQSAQGIAVQTASYPVTLNWEMRQARNGAVFALEDVKTGRIVSLISGSEGKTILPSPAPGGLKLVYLPEGAGSLIPKDYALEQNAPNPFNPTTRISFALPEDAQVRLDIYTITGQIVSRLVDGPLHAGYHDYEWNPGASAGGASGIYFYRLQAVSAQDQSKIFTSTRKMLFLK